MAKKLQIKKYKLTKLFFVWLIYCLALGIFNSTVMAQSPTPTASSTTVDREEENNSPDVIDSEDNSENEQVASEIKDTIKQRLEKTIGDNVDKIQGLIDEEKSNLKKRAFAGQIESMTENTLTINTDDDVKQASFSEETNLIKLPGRSSVDIENLEVGDFIIAMGFLNESEVLETRRIVISPQPKPAPERKLFWGKIEEIDDKIIVFDNEEIDLPSEKLLQIRGLDEASFDDVSLGDKLFILATIDKNGEIDSVEKVLVVPVKNALEIQTTPIETESTEEENQDSESEDEPENESKDESGSNEKDKNINISTSSEENTTE